MGRAHFAPLLLLAWATVACASGGSPHALAPPRDSAAERVREASELARKGKAAARAGDSVRAEQYLTLAIERGANRRELLPELLAVCLASSRLRAALNHARSYLQDHPDDDQLRYLVASLHLSLGQAEEARQSLELLLRANPNNANAHYLFGVLSAEEDPASARDHFQTYLALQPRHPRAPEVRSRLAELLIREDTREASALAPSKGRAWRDVRVPRTRFAGTRPNGDAR